MFYSNKHKLMLWYCLFTHIILTFSSNEEQSNSASSDDNKLKQALVIVDILKSEYEKLQKENKLLRSQLSESSVKETTVTGYHDSTCANTNKDYEETTLKEERKAVDTDSAKEIQLSFTPLFMQTPPNRGFNKRILKQRLAPLEYYNYNYFEYPFRRRAFYGPPGGHGQNFRKFAAQTGLPGDYGQPFRRFAGQTELKPTTDNITIEVKAVKKEIKKDYKLAEVGNNQSTVAKSTKTKTLSTYQHTKPRTKPTTTLLLPFNVQPSEDSTQECMEKKTTVKDKSGSKSQVLSQVAMEIVNELKHERIPIKGYRRSGTEKEANKTQIRKGKPILKIHLGKSSKLPIPLPENNAFCHLNPNNALCRTAI